jgi:hypothetical protein
MNRQPYAASERKPTKTALALDGAYLMPNNREIGNKKLKLSPGEPASSGVLD